MTRILTNATTTCISAPGKVLVAGGYLVLDQKYSGLVIGTDSRFYTTITSLNPNQTLANTKLVRRITVRSPQFDDGKWVYSCGIGSSSLNPCALNQDVAVNTERNKYVEYALSLSLSVASFLSPDFLAKFGSELDVLIVGHNDFYSQRAQLESRNLPISTESLQSLEPFCAALTTIGKVHKTGLGSSAAMITSLVSAILVHFEVISIPSGEHGMVEFAHNMAQFVHCLAQGKVGSGFDVSSAVFGSHIYRRFDPEILADLMAFAEEVGVGYVDGEKILKVVRGVSKWDTQVQPFKLPLGIKLMLADVDAGSSTPKLVSGVLGWREANPVQ
ncbi:phosphomevalonate kinase, partial [Physocladia obscura]